MKFIEIYDDNEALILERRREFDAFLDIEKTIEICRRMCREAEEDEEEVRDLANRIPEENPFEELFRNPNSDVDAFV
ncbi:ATP-dependent DNA helicase PIF1-like [Aphis craccivora]|uniref:ATP-dependent DNA helicase PIF1-like n=1 Tax=Aphis craccivora TaxID=307492 RepID=A0A6G0XZ87_APHCR|nr:ATP-dependent DNA helicase PIF1-like [Aphis craccivora]